MSIVADQLRRVDSQLDRLHISPLRSASSSPVISARNAIDDKQQIAKILSSPRVAELQSIIKALSTTSSSRTQLSSWRISSLLKQAELPEIKARAQSDAQTAYETELEWLLVGKATVQTYGLILNTLLEQTIPLSNDMWYWDEVLGSYSYTALYTIQTAPLRFRDWTKEVYLEARRRLARLGQNAGDVVIDGHRETTFTAQWKQFYRIVQDSIHDRSIANLQSHVLSPLALCRSEARRKQAGLKRLRELSASGIGVLIDEALTFDDEEIGAGADKGSKGDSHEWKGVVERSVALMDSVLCNVTALETGVSEFEDAVFARIADDPDLTLQTPEEGLDDRTSKLARRLNHILEVDVANHKKACGRLVGQYGRPSRLIRYWLPATALILSSTTLLRLLVNRKPAILTWIREFGATIQDFWMNWVVDPTKKVIGTIRHDKDSEVAIMSKESLKGDRDSLERMVVEFAIDNPETSGFGKNALNDAQISEIRSKVKEGDLTPVLRAYEKDLRKPFVGTVRGDLIRTLLIQVQKTKVDVEVALSGIDALLKSQELVFGFVGLTPGILVCVGAARYLQSVFGNRRGIQKGRKAGQTIRLLRNIDRILTTSTPLSNGMLGYKDHGLLLCEVHVLRSKTKRLFPGDVEREFLEDVNELADISIGVEKQIKVAERIRWAYNRWLSQ